MTPQLLHLKLRPPVVLVGTSTTASVATHHVVIGVHDGTSIGSACHAIAHDAASVDHTGVLVQLLKDLIRRRQVLGVVIVVGMRIVVPVMLHVVTVGGWRGHCHVVVRLILETNLIGQIHYLQRHVWKDSLLLLEMRLLGQALRLCHGRQELLLLDILQQLEVRGRGRRGWPDGHLLRHLLVFHCGGVNLFLSQISPLYPGHQHSFCFSIFNRFSSIH